MGSYIWLMLRKAAVIKGLEGKERAFHGRESIQNKALTVKLFLSSKAFLYNETEIFVLTFFSLLLCT